MTNKKKIPYNVFGNCLISSFYKTVGDRLTIYYLHEKQCQLSNCYTLRWKFTIDSLQLFFFITLRDWEDIKWEMDFGVVLELRVYL